MFQNTLIKTCNNITFISQVIIFADIVRNKTSIFFMSFYKIIFSGSLDIKIGK